jgi:hypothetical protein
MVERADLRRHALDAILAESLQRVTSPRHGRRTIVRVSQDGFAILVEVARKKECDVATKFGGKRRGGLVSGVPDRRPARSLHVVVRDGDKGLEVMRVPLEGKGPVLPVFSAGWAARGYLVAEESGGGWYVRAYTPDEMISMLAGPCAGVEWVAFDPMPGRRSASGVANMMPRENFVDYLLCSRVPLSFRRSDSETIVGAPHRRENDQ